MYLAVFLAHTRYVETIRKGECKGNGDLIKGIHFGKDNGL